MPSALGVPIFCASSIRGPAQNRTVVLQIPTSGFSLQSTPFQALVASPYPNHEIEGGLSHTTHRRKDDYEWV